MVRLAGPRRAWDTAGRDIAPRRPADRSLLDLAAKHRIATEYWDWQGQHVPVTAPAIRSRCSPALGVEARYAEAVRAALADADAARLAAGAAADRGRAAEGWTPWVPVHVPHGTGVDG